MTGRTVIFTYRNHKGAERLRRVQIQSLDFFSNPGYGYQPGWHLTGLDLDKNEVRSFALSHIVFEPDTKGANIRMRIPL